MNYSDYVVQEAADLGLVCVPMALLEEHSQQGDTYNRGPGDTYTYDSDYDNSEEPFQYESMCIPSEPSHGTYSLINPEFPGMGPVVDSFLDETLEDFGAFHEGVPVNPACSTPQPYRSPSPGLQRTFDIARPHGATFNVGRNSNTFNAGRASNTFDVGRNSNTFNVGRACETFNVGRGSNTFNAGRNSNTFIAGRACDTFNVGRPSNTFNVGRPSNTFNVGRASNTFDVGRGANTFNVGRPPGNCGVSPGLEYNFTPVMNETYDIQEGDDCQEYPSDITHGTYTLAYPDVCFPPTPEALFNSTISSGGTAAFCRDAPAWPAQSSPNPRTPPGPVRTRPISTPRRFIRMDRRIRSNWLPRGTGRRLNFNDLSGNCDDPAGTPGSYLANFNQLSREFVDEILCDASANLGVVSSPARRHRTMP